MRRTIVCLALCCSTLLPAFASEQARSVQEELRRRNIYFGDIDGRSSDELSQAISRYQKRKGLAATGREDPDTLRSLGLLARSPDEPAPRELAWPEEPVLKSDQPIDVRAAAREIAAETGVSAASVAPATIGERPGPERKARANNVPIQPGPMRESRARAVDQPLTPAEIGRFVRDYLQAISRNDLRGELRFYADNVNYFHSGKVDRRIIERSLRDYYQHWNRRRYSAADNPRVRFIPERAEYVVMVHVNFELRNSNSKVRGQTENQYVISAATADPRIISIQERRVRR